MILYITEEDIKRWKDYQTSALCYGDTPLHYGPAMFAINRIHPIPVQFVPCKILYGIPKLPTSFHLSAECFML